MDKSLWKVLAETFGNDLTVIKSDYEKVLVRIKCIPSAMREWVLAHGSQCEVIAPKYFRDEIQRVVMEAYKKYWR